MHHHVLIPGKTDKLSPLKRSWHTPCQVRPFCSRAEMSC